MAVLDSPIDVPKIAAQLEGAPVDEILQWAADTFGPRVTFGTGFGVEGCIIVHTIGTRRLPIDIFTLDTGLLFPETMELWRTLEQRYGVVIRAVRPAQTVEQQALHWGPALWARDPDQCCRLRKVEPLRTALAGKEGWITAIRREQTPARASAKVVEIDARFGVVKINPLVHWTHKEVWRYVFAHDIPYNLLHDNGFPSIGCWPCTSPVAEGEDPRSGRWRLHRKQECGLHAES
ncbi:MAG TPA: phosphoadenylyl-sulfate reductase [Vicinamibacterales bacterium]|nr:phosphoadenylyl-sulfate reductase [Vicinamibacterales bacterium]